MTTAELRTRRPLAAKFGAIGCLLLTLAMVSIGLTLWVTWQLEGGAAAVNEAGRMRMQTWRLAQTISARDTALLAPRLNQLDQSMALLHQGDPARPLAVPPEAASHAALAAAQQEWTRLRERWQHYGTGAPESARVADEATSFVVTIDQLVDTIERQLAQWTTILNSAQIAMMTLAVAAAIALLYAAQLLVFNPLVRLQDGLSRVEAGDLSARVDATGDDEFGVVARGFNRMTLRLEDLYTSLENRVQEKTEHLEAERARLAALYEATACAARADTLPALAQEFAVHMRAVARADACAVRWSDEQNRRYVLLGSDQLPLSLSEAEHCVPSGECFCGQLQANAHTRVFPLTSLRVDRSSDSVDTGQCQRAGFTSLVSVPVRLHERMVGEIDLFYRTPRMLDQEDRALFDALASHLAGAMESQRADALQREAAVAEERSLLARELHDSIAQGLAFLKIQASLLRDAVFREPIGRTARVQDTLSELDVGIRESMSDVRELLLHFRTRTNVEDFVPALRTTLTKFEHQTGLSTELHVAEEGMALPPDVQVQVLHVVQEALSNVRKHALAQGVRIDVKQSPQWVIEVRDDGRGMNAAAQVPDETHVGMRIMHERAAGIGASLGITSEPGIGTRVTLTLPRVLAASEPAPESHDTRIA